MSDAAEQRDGLLAELVALWAGGGAPLCLLPDGSTALRSEREAQLIQALRPLCWQAALAAEADDDDDPDTGGRHARRAEQRARREARRDDRGG